MYVRIDVGNCPVDYYTNCPLTLGPTYQPALIDYVRV